MTYRFAVCAAIFCVSGCAPDTDGEGVLLVDVSDNVEEDELGDYHKGEAPSLAGPPTYTGQTQSIFRYHCSPCHAGESPDECDGGTCFVSDPSTLPLPAYTVTCPNMTKAECGLQRIRITQPGSTAPASDRLIGPDDQPILMARAYIDAIDYWIAHGMPR